MMITKKNLKRHELIGLEVEVLKSKNKTQEKVEGRVIDETQKTLKIQSGRKEKIIQKVGSVFRFTLPKGGKVKIIGDEIAVKPEERVKKW